MRSTIKIVGALDTIINAWCGAAAYALASLFNTQLVGWIIMKMVKIGFAIINCNMHYSLFDYTFPWIKNIISHVTNCY